MGGGTAIGEDVEEDYKQNVLWVNNDYDNDNEDGECDYTQFDDDGNRIIDENVYVLLIVDGRRDMQTLLQRRLLET